MELIEYLRSEGILQEFLRNFLRANTEFEKMCKSGESCNLSYDIGCAFVWLSTKEGGKFWDAHYNKCCAEVSFNDLKRLVLNYKKPSIFRSSHAVT